MLNGLINIARRVLQYNSDKRDIMRDVFSMFKEILLGELDPTDLSKAINHFIFNFDILQEKIININ